jgi:hypothetical protein
MTPTGLCLVALPLDVARLAVRHPEDVRNSSRMTAVTAGMSVEVLSRHCLNPLDPDAPELSEIKTIPISVEFPKITKLIVSRRLKMISR